MEIEVRFDATASIDATEAQALALLDGGVVARLASRAGYYVHVEDGTVSVFGAGPYYTGGEDEDGNLVLTAQNEATDWLCWAVESLTVSVYGPGLREVDFVWRIVPLHDSHARFTRAVYEMTARVKG